MNKNEATMIWRPKDRVLRYLFAYFLYAIIIPILLLTEFDYLNLNTYGKLFYWFSWVMAGAFLFFSLAIASFYFMFKGSRPLISIFKDHITLDYGKSRVMIINRGEVKRIIRKRESKIYITGIKFKKLDLIINKIKKLKGERNLINKIYSYYALKTNKIPIKFKHFFSGKYKDDIYIATKILQLNQKKGGYHIFFFEMDYAYNKKLFPTLRKLEQPKLSEHLKQSLL